MNVLYLSSFALKYYVICRVREMNQDENSSHFSLQVIVAIRNLDEPEFLTDVQNVCNLSESKQWNIYQTFYWLNAGNSSSVRLSSSPDLSLA